MLSKITRKVPIALLAIGLLFAIGAASASATPSRTTLPATMVDATVATLNATISAEGHRTDYAFSWGTTPNIEDWSEVSTIQTTEARTPFDIYEPITGLEMGTTYYFLVGTFDHVTQQIEYGEVRSFTTLSATHPSQFLSANGYPAKLWGTFTPGNDTVFKAAGGNLKVNCTTHGVGGSLAAASSTLSIVPQLSGCTSAAPTSFGSATVRMNSCSYDFNVGGTGYAWGLGFFSIACTSPGDAIEYSFSGVDCIVRVPAQEPRRTASYYNEGPATNRQITIQGNPGNISYTTNGRLTCLFAGIPSSGQDGVIDFTNSIVQATTGQYANYSELYVSG